MATETETKILHANWSASGTKRTSDLPLEVSAFDAEGDTPQPGPDRLSSATSGPNLFRSKRNHRNLARPSGLHTERIDRRQDFPARLSTKQALSMVSGLAAHKFSKLVVAVALALRRNPPTVTSQDQTGDPIPADTLSEPGAGTAGSSPRGPGSSSSSQAPSKGHSAPHPRIARLDRDRG